MKKLAYIYYYLFLFILLIFGLFSGDLKVKAEETTSWSTQQARIQTTHDGTDTWTSWENISGDSSKVYEPTYPVKAIAYHLKTSRGMNKNYTYHFRFNYKPTPDSLGLQEYYFENSTTGDRENVTCVQTMSSAGYYWFDCSFSPVVSYSADDYLYVKLNFYQSYLTELRVGVRGYEELIGVNQVITEQTDNIINNNNQNTQEIINNINQANDDLMNKLEEVNGIPCKNILNINISNGNNNGISWIVNEDKTITLNGTATTTTYIRVADNFTIQPGTYTLSAGVYVNTLTRIQLVEDTSGRPLLASTQNALSQTFTTTSTKNVFLQIRINSGEVINTTFYPQLEKGSTATSYCKIGTYKNGNQAVSDGINDLNNNITNDEVDNPSSSLTDMEALLPSNGVITQLIALPITLFQKVLNSINGTCSQFDLGELYGTHLIMPCIDLSTYLGNSLITTIDLIISGVFVLTIARKMIKAFENFTSMKEGDVIND